MKLFKENYRYICEVRIVKKIEQFYPKHLFWDMDYSKLSFSKDKTIIIPRALYATTPETFLSDVEKLEEIYTSAEIVTCLQNTKERISNKVCEMISQRYDIPVFYRYKV
jgi:hypothetical protein